MIVTNLTADDLKKLPLRAIVAFAARCARRVEHIAVLAADHPESRAMECGDRGGHPGRRGLRPRPAVSDGRIRGPRGRSMPGVRTGRSRGERTPTRPSCARSTRRRCASHAIALREEPAERRLASGGPPLNPLPPHLADLTADLAALGAFTAAMDAAEAVASTDDFTMWAARDYRDCS